MKPALVLGLALAANALTVDQGDNELIIAPTDQFGNIKQYPGHIRFDEQGDDELLIRPISTHVADDELLVRPLSYHVADDELIVAPTDEFGRIKQYPPYIRFDEDGNEFFVAPTHRLGDIGHRILYDDELAARAGEMKELLERQFEFKGRLDDEADAELMIAPYRRFDHVEGRKVYDDEADDELMRAPYRRGFDHVEGRKVYDDEADTELMMAPLDGTGKYNRRRFDDLTTRKAYDDDELVIRPVKPIQEHFRPAGPSESYHHSAPGLHPTLFVNRSPVMRNDDEGDDELAYLGELIKQHKMDRFRDHELPEIKGRFKPMNNGGFLPIN